MNTTTLMKDRGRQDHGFRLLVCGAADPAVIERGVAAVLAESRSVTARTGTVILTRLRFRFDANTLDGNFLLYNVNSPAVAPALLAELLTRELAVAPRSVELSGGSRLEFRTIGPLDTGESVNGSASGVLFHGRFEFDLATAAITAADRPEHGPAPAPNFLRLERAFAQSLSRQLHTTVQPGPLDEAAGRLAVRMTVAELEPDSEAVFEFEFEHRLSPRELIRLENELNAFFPEWFLPLPGGPVIRGASLRPRPNDTPIVILRF